VISARFLKPLDENLIIESVRKTHAIVTIENNSISGGFGSGVLEILSKHGIDKRTLLLGFPDEPVPHGTRRELFEKYKLNPRAIAGQILKFLNLWEVKSM
ncbi:MAG: transketolase C-terminal domain-containing protein, partial [Eubacteriales bacterium]|nr:transketolase C-terminal domain-containing protein [Eubacteriales bacterium]